MAERVPSTPPAPLLRPLRKARPRREPIGQAPVPVLWAVACSVCDQLGPLSAKRARGAAPPRRSGFQFLVLGEIGGWWCRRCIRKRQSLLPPATRAGCIEGPRPCPRTLCRYHLGGDVSRKAPKGFVVPETCALDVADRGEHTLRGIGELLGMTREGTRGVQVIALDKLRRVPGIAFEFADDEGDDDAE